MVNNTGDALDRSASDVFRTDWVKRDTLQVRNDACGSLYSVQIAGTSHWGQRRGTGCGVHGMTDQLTNYQASAASRRLHCRAREA